MKKAVDIKKIITLGDLKKSGYKSKSIKEEIRENLIACIQKKKIHLKVFLVMRIR